MVYVGVDIGSCAIKAAAIKKAGKTFTVLQTHFFSIKPDGGEEQKRLLRLSHLKTLADLYVHREAQYIFCFSQNEVSTEKLSFPFKERYKIMKSLPFQMEEKLSLFDHKSLISDIKTRFHEGEKEVLVFSVFKDRVAGLLKELHSVKIQPHIVTCEAGAVANLFEAEKPETAAPNGKVKSGRLYLKIGHTHTMALMFSGGALHDVYSFGWGAASCIRKIALKYEVPLSKAMEQFCEKAFILTQTRGYTGSQISFSKVIQEAFENLVDKLRLLLIQLEGENTYKCEKIFIFGGGAQVRNLQAFLSTRLNISVARVDQPLRFPDWNLRHNDERHNNLATALGSAMEGLKKPRSPAVNFLKEEFARKFNPFSFILLRWRQPLLYGLGCLALLFVYSTLRHHYSEKLSDKTHKLFQKKSTQIAKLRPKQVSIQKVKAVIRNRKKITNRTKFTEKLSRIPSALDKVKTLSVSIKIRKSWNMEIEELNIMGDKVEIRGRISARHLEVLEKNLTELAEGGSLKNIGKTPPGPPAEPAEEAPKESPAADTVVFNYSFVHKKG